MFAMSGGALAAKHYLINSTKQINPKVLKSLKGNTGAAGVPGTQGKEGPQGKEGAPNPNAVFATNAGHATSADSATVAKGLPALTWTNLTLENGAVVYGSGIYGTPSYTKDAEGFVHLSGALDGSKVTTFFATLPAGFRPTRANNTWLRAAATNGGSDPHLVDIYIDSTTGTMWLELGGTIGGTASTAAFVDLEGVSFYAG
ncbi:MAG TPA: hypothetical protein VNY27_06160 [Solirubrobacteraceae bacterium]|nr:hypothetical protein [Solirubrobacteraceae bacterium]